MTPFGAPMTCPAPAVPHHMDSLQRLRDALGEVPVGTITAHATAEPDPNARAAAVDIAMRDLCRRRIAEKRDPELDEFTEWAGPLLAALEALTPRERRALAQGVYDATFAWTPGGFTLWQPVAEISAAMGAHP